MDVPEAAAVPANWPTNGASPAEALQAQVAKELANDPLAEVCFRAETARARGNACFGENDIEGAVAEWTESIKLSGSHARCAESKALALANRSLARLNEWADVRGGHGILPVGRHHMVNCQRRDELRQRWEQRQH